MTMHRDLMPDNADALDGLREAGVIDEAQHAAAMRLVEDRHRERTHYGHDFHPSRRTSDKMPAWAVWVWGVLRNLAVLVALGLAFYAATQIVSTVERQREGRAIAVEVLCGFGNGVAKAGRNVIAGRDPRTGEPLPGVRRGRQSDRDAAARAYARAVSRSVQAQLDPPIPGLVVASGPRAGLLDCRKLQHAARTQADP